MGEVRDRDSAELAIEAAITGHKVLTTIHTPRASQIIERFEQIGIERWKIAVSDEIVEVTRWRYAYGEDTLNP
jgi:type II secretory ATPase GspE/PulE/Tfp pilus assembly ATPase PilB-like protein